MRRPILTVAVVFTLYVTKSWITKKRYTPHKDVDKIVLQNRNFNNIIMTNMPYPIQWIVTRSIYYPSHFLNIFYWKTLGDKHSWFTRITDNVLLGATISGKYIEWLFEHEEVMGIINLQEEYIGDVTTHRKYGIAQLHIPVVDFCSPSLDQINKAIEFIDTISAKGKSVYIHCKAGKGRSTSIVLCYLMYHDRIDRKTALRRIISVRPQVSKYLWDLPVVKEFERVNNLPKPKD